MDHSSTGFLVLAIVVLFLSVIVLYLSIRQTRTLHDIPQHTEERMTTLLTEMHGAINEARSAFAPRDHNP